MMNIIFVFTLGIFILNLMFYFSLFAKRQLDLTLYEPSKYSSFRIYISPMEWWVFYPSFFYQVYWWCGYLNLI